MKTFNKLLKIILGKGILIVLLLMYLFILSKMVFADFDPDLNARISGMISTELESTYYIRWRMRSSKNAPKNRHAILECKVLPSGECEIVGKELFRWRKPSSTPRWYISLQTPSSQITKFYIVYCFSDDECKNISIGDNISSIQNSASYRIYSPSVEVQASNMENNETPGSVGIDSTLYNGSNRLVVIVRNEVAARFSLGSYRATIYPKNNPSDIIYSADDSDRNVNDRDTRTFELGFDGIPDIDCSNYKNEEFEVNLEWKDYSFDMGVSEAFKCGESGAPEATASFGNTSTDDPPPEPTCEDICLGEIDDQEVYRQCCLCICGNTNCSCDLDRLYPETTATKCLSERHSAGQNVWTEFGCIEGSNSGVIMFISRLFVGIITALSVVRFVQAGFMLNTDDPEKIKEGKSIAISALIAMIFGATIPIVLNFIGIDILGIGKLFNIVN